jgi:hypothetical protein
LSAKQRQIYLVAKQRHDNLSGLVGKCDVKGGGNMNRDKAGQAFKEVDINKDRKLRFTLVESGNGFECGPCIRIQGEEPKGKLQQGPEIPVKSLPSCMAVLIELSLGQEAENQWFRDLREFIMKK